MRESIKNNSPPLNFPIPSLSPSIFHFYTPLPWRFFFLSFKMKYLLFTLHKQVKQVRSSLLILIFSLGTISPSSVQPSLLPERQNSFELINLLKFKFRSLIIVVFEFPQCFILLIINIRACWVFKLKPFALKINSTIN